MFYLKIRFHKKFLQYEIIFRHRKIFDDNLGITLLDHFAKILKTISFYSSSVRFFKLTISFSIPCWFRTIFHVGLEPFDIWIFDCKNSIEYDGRAIHWKNILEEFFNSFCHITHYFTKLIELLSLRLWLWVYQYIKAFIILYLQTYIFKLSWLNGKWIKKLWYPLRATKHIFWSFNQYNLCLKWKVTYPITL